MLVSPCPLVSQNATAVLNLSSALPRRLTEQVQQLAADGDQLRRENERLCRVIDSGDWGRQRVEELLQAGGVLQEERDALARLVRSLQQQQPASVAPQDGAHECDARPPLCQPASLDGGGVARPSAAQREAACSPARQRQGLRPASPSAARNRLLVRTGSSFNAMVRALKQDLLASGALERSPGVVVEVDKVRAMGGCRCCRWRRASNFQPGGAPLLCALLETSPPLCLAAVAE
jgi:hypothetical protein